MSYETFIMKLVLWLQNLSLYKNRDFCLTTFWNFMLFTSCVFKKIHREKYLCIINYTKWLKPNEKWMELNEIESSSLKNQILWSFWIYAHIHLHSQILFYILRSENSQKFAKISQKNSQKWRKIVKTWHWIWILATICMTTSGHL